jgi:hypothetical protein
MISWASGDPAEAMEVLDRLLKFFGGGERPLERARFGAPVGRVRYRIPNSERTRPTPTPDRRSRPIPDFDRPSRAERYKFTT